MSIRRPWPITLRIMGVLSNPDTFMSLFALKERGDKGSLSLRNLRKETENLWNGNIIAGPRMASILSILEREYLVTRQRSEGGFGDIITITAAGKGAVNTVKLFQAAALKSVFRKIPDSLVQQQLQKAMDGDL